MLIHKTLNIFLCSSIIIIGGCAHSYAPKRWLPDTQQIQTEAFGGWLTIEYKIQNKKTEKVGGEYITSDSTNVYILYDSLFIIPKEKITRAILEIDNKNISSYAGWTALGSISTLSHGKFLIFTFPIWIITGVSATSGESYRDRYEDDNPTDIYWNKIIKFARFPQGIPENINLNILRRKEINEKK